MKPGATINPAASKTSAPFALEMFPGAAISAMRSPSSRMSRAESDLDAGSRTRPFLIRNMRGFLWLIFAFAFERWMRALRCANHQQVKNGHAHRHSVGHLFKYGGLRPIRNFRGNFRAAIDGTGMQNQSIRLGELHAFGMQLVQEQIIIVRERRLVQSLGLHSQHDNHVGAIQRLFHSVHAPYRRPRRSNFFEFARNPHGWTTQREAAAKFS